MDATTSAGFSPDYVAKEIIKAIVSESPELVITQFNSRVAIYLRTLIPWLYFWIMYKRAKKSE